MNVKNILTLLLISISIEATAQNKTCNMQDGQLHEVYVFSKNTSHTLLELFGERVSPNTLNVIYVKTPEDKTRLDSLCFKGNMSGTFIFPNKDASKTIRICNIKEYTAALKSKMELKIEEE